MTLPYRHLRLANREHPLQSPASRHSRPVPRRGGGLLRRGSGLRQLDERPHRDAFAVEAVRQDAEAEDAILALAEPVRRLAGARLFALELERLGPRRGAQAGGGLLRGPLASWPSLLVRQRSLPRGE